MLKILTWQEFILALVVLTVCWYVMVWLLYYRKKKGFPDEPLPHSWQKGVDELHESENLLGKPALDQGVEVLAAEDFGFADPETQLGVVADAREEIKAACRKLEDTSGSKADFFSLFAEISSKYASLLPEKSKQLLGDYLRERVPFFLSDEELENLWLA